MTTDSREKQKLPYSTFTSKKWQQRKTAMAISMATCLFLGAIGYEIVREKEPLLESPAQTMHFPEDNKYDPDLIVQYNESIQKIKELKKLLFLQEHVPQNKKVAELQALLQEKENHINSLSESLSQEKDKNNTLNISLSSLADFIEVQRVLADNSYKALQEERDRLISQNLAEQDLIIANFERHISNQETTFAALKEKLEKEKAETLAALEMKLLIEKEASQRILQENEQVRKEFMASLEQKFLDQNENIKRLQSQNESLEDFYSVKEQALQSTESAWRDYALDLSQELQTLEKELAIKEEQRFVDEEEIKRLARKIEQLEDDAAKNNAFVKDIEKEFDYLGKLYSQLEEKYHIEKILAAFQETPKPVDVQQLEQLTSQVEQYRQEAFIASQALQMEKKVSETLFDDMNFYLAQSQEFKKKLAASKKTLKELDGSYAEFIEELSNKNVELEDNQNILTLHLALLNELASKDLAFIKANHNAAMQQAEEAIAVERKARNAIENELAVLQAHYEEMVANNDKSASVVDALKQEREQLMASLENIKLEFDQYKNSQLNELEASKLAISELHFELQEALSKQEEMQARMNEDQSYFNVDKIRLLQENEAYKMTANHLEMKLAKAQANYEEMLDRLSSEKEVLENTKQSLIAEIEAQRLATVQIEKQLTQTGQLQVNDQFVASQEQSRLLKELAESKRLIAEFESKLNEAYAKHEQVEAKFKEDETLYLNEKKQFLQTISLLESRIKEANDVAEELKTVKNKTLQLEIALAKTGEIIKNFSDNELTFNTEKANLLQELESYKILSENLENQLLITTNKVDELQSRLEEEHSLLSNDKTTLMQEIESYKIISSHLETKIEELQARLLEENSSKTALQLEIANLEGKVRQTTDKAEELHASLREKYAFLSNEADSYKANASIMENELKELSSKLREEQASKEALLLEIANLDAKLKNASIRTEELQANLDAANATLSNDKTLLLQEVESYKLISTHLEAKLSELQAHLYKEELEKSELLQTFNQKEGALTADVENHKLLVSQLEAKLNEINLKVEQLQAHLLEEEANKTKLLQAKNQLEEKLKDFIQESSNYKLELTSSNDSLIELRLQLQEEQKTRTELENVLTSTKNEFEERLLHLNNEIQTLLAREHETNENLLSYQDAIQDTQILYKQRIEDLKIESDALAIELEKEHNLNIAQKEKHSFEKNYLETQIAKLKSDMASLNEKLVAEINVNEEKNLYALSAKEKEYQEALATILLLKEELIEKENSYENLNEFLADQTAKLAFLQKSLDDEIQKNNQINIELSALQSSIQEKDELLLELSEREKHLKVELEEKMSVLSQSANE